MGIRDTYRELFADIRRKKYLLILASSLFLLSAALSIIPPSPGLRKMLAEAIDALRNMSVDYHSRTLPAIIGSIFFHNAVALCAALFSGVIVAIIPALFLIANGYVVGTLVIPNLSMVGLMLPHGIFELPAAFLATSYGIWLGLWPFNRNRVETIRLRLKTCVAVYFYVVLPLLLIAAIIEGGLFLFMAVR